MPQADVEITAPTVRLLPWAALLFFAVAILSAPSVRGSGGPPPNAWVAPVCCIAAIGLASLVSARRGDCLTVYVVFGALAGAWLALMAAERSRAFNPPWTLGSVPPLWSDLVALTYWAALPLATGLLARLTAEIRIQAAIRAAARRANRCASCGYLLHGLPEPRCPECGQPFERAQAAEPPFDE